MLDHIAYPRRIMAPVRWYGGKGVLAKWIVQYLPEHQLYVEPYCGAASVFWHKTPSPIEVLNDLNNHIVNLFRVLQSPEQFEEFAHRITWTLYSRSEFAKAIEMLQDENASDIELAWALFVTANQGFSGQGKTVGQWSRSITTSNRGMAETTNKWRGRMALLSYWHDRLTRVQLDNRNALDVIQYWDGPNTLFYLDPPYVLSTRKDRAAYSHEVDDAHHKDLVDLLLTIQGKVVLSGYDNDLYRCLTDAGWAKMVNHTACRAAGRTRSSNIRGKGTAFEHVPRTEVLWINKPRQPGLFA